MSKKALLIARYFYPGNASGAHRPAKLAKYLPEFGWTPVVLCAEWTPENSGNMYDPILAAQPDVCRTVRIPYPAMPPTKIGRAPRRVAEILFPYRAPFGFTRRMLAAAEDLVRQEHFDVIWSTYMPGLTHYVASRIARRYGIPWVADFRDLPDQFVHYGWRARRVLKAERRVCWWARAVVTVSQPLADCLARRYRAPVHVILNGFDPDDFPPKESGLFPKFAIAYFGSVQQERDPRPLFAAVDRLLEMQAVRLEDLRLDFYGSLPATVEQMASGFRCCDAIQCHPRVPHSDMLRLQREALVLLLLSHTLSRGVMTGKVFEYLAAGRPILDVPGGDVTRALLEETRAGVSAGDPSEIADVMVKWYREWKRTGTVAYCGIPEKIARYTRREQAGQLARIFDLLTVGGPGGAWKAKKFCDIG